MKTLLIEKFPPYNFYPLNGELEILWNGVDHFYLTDEHNNEQGIFFLIDIESVRKDFNEEQIKSYSLGVIKLKYPSVSRFVSFRPFFLCKNNKYIVGFFTCCAATGISEEHKKEIYKVKKNIDYVLTTNFIKSNEDNTWRNRL